MIKFEKIDETFHKEWDNFVESHPNGTLFHTSRWLETIEKTQGVRKLQYGIYHHNELVGVFPLFIKKYWLLKVAASPFLLEDTPYMGPVIDPLYFDEAMQVFDMTVRKLKIHYTRMMLRNFYPCDDLNRLGYEVICKHTHILALSLSVDELWKGMEGRCRTAIRKAKKSGIKIKHAEKRSWIEQYYSMYEKLYKRQNKNLPNTKEFFYLLWDSFFPNNLTILIAEYEGQSIAGAIIVKHKDTAYYLDGVSIKDFNRLAPNSLLQWEAIKHAKNEGYKAYDFVGSDLPWLAKFKKSFGGTLVTYLCLERASNNWVRYLRSMYPTFKNLLRRIRNQIPE